MTDRRHHSGWRSAAFAAALFAITFNFLQPLAHAALMRDGAPATLWSVFCNAQQDGRQQTPLAAEKHECCLGLAYAAAFAAPAMVAAIVEPVAKAARPLRSAELLTAVGIRDGP